MLRLVPVNKPWQTWCQTVLTALFLLGVAIGPATNSFSQTYPAKSVRLIVGFSPGGSTDASARVFGQRLAEYLGQAVIIENRPGAGTALANELVAKSPPDGYTLVSLTASATGVSALRKDLPYDLERDFSPISLVATTTYVLIVHPSVPARTPKELIALASKYPGKLTTASEGFATSGHLAAELFKSMASLDILHVAFKGGSQASTAVASGEVDMSFPTITSALPMLSAGKIRILAVTGKTRSFLKPEIPTLDESGLKGFDRTSWNGLAGPTRVPRDIIARLQAATIATLANPALKSGFQKLGMEGTGSTPEQMATLIRSEIAQNTKLVQAIKVKNN